MNIDGSRTAQANGIRELSLVAEIDGLIAGHHLQQSKVRLPGKVLPVLNFGPLSVQPEYQRKGIGSALVRQ